MSGVSRWGYYYVCVFVAGNIWASRGPLVFVVGAVCKHEGLCFVGVSSEGGVYTSGRVVYSSRVGVTLDVFVADV